MYVNPLDTVSAGLVWSVNHHLLHELPQKRRGQFGGLSVLLHDFQKTLNIDGLGFDGIHDGPEVFNRLFQVRLFLLVALGQLRKPFCVQLAHNVVLIEPLDDGVQFVDLPLLLFQGPLGLLLLRPLYGGLVLRDTPYKLVLDLLGIGHYSLQVLEDQPLQNYGPDIVCGALIPVTVIGASVTFLAACP